MTLLTSEQLWRKYGQFASMSSMYNLIAAGVKSEQLKKEEVQIKAGRDGHYAVPAYCELCFCKYVFANRRNTFAAKVFVRNIAVISKVIASDSKIAVP